MDPAAVRALDSDQAERRLNIFTPGFSRYFPHSAPGANPLVVSGFLYSAFRTYEISIVFQFYDHSSISETLGNYNLFHRRKSHWKY